MLARFEWRMRQGKNLQSTGSRLSSRLFFLIIASLFLMAWVGYHHLVQPAWLNRAPQLFEETLNLLESGAALTLLIVFLIYGFRASVKRRKLAGLVTREDLYALSPKGFERYVANLFRDRGYEVTVRGRSGDHGVDLELTRADGRRAIVQCKRYRNAIGPDIVRELFGTMIHERVHHAFLVTTADISDAAREWAQNKPITLIDGSALEQIARSLQSVPGSK